MLLKQLFATKKRQSALILILLSFLVLEVIFVWLTSYISVNPNNSLDFSVAQVMQQMSNPWLTRVMVFVSAFGEFYIGGLLLLILALWLYERVHWLGVFSALVVSVLPIIYWLLKIAIARPRPEYFHFVSYQSLSDYSFPSAHVTFYVLFFGFVCLLALTLPGLKKWLRVSLTTVSLVLIALIGFSRVYLGVHWLTDVIGGYVLGLCLLEIAALFYLTLVYYPLLRHAKRHGLSR